MNKKLLSNVKIHILVIMLTVISESIGVRKFNLGLGVIVIFPMLYALIMGAILSWPSIKVLKEREMTSASNVLGISFILMIAKLGIMIGPSIMKIFDEGWALIFQEVGHFLGTVIFALPLAILLGMKREAIGATFSIDRENSLAIIAEKFGVESEESRGAIGVYICGTLFGPIYLGVLSGILGSSGLFHPYALAMGAGIGSGSMMAAASGALVALFPDLQNNITVFAGAANLATGIWGTFICAFISLPLTVRIYEWLEPKVSKKKMIFKAWKGNL